MDAPQADLAEIGHGRLPDLAAERLLQRSRAHKDLAGQQARRPIQLRVLLQKFDRAANVPPPAGATRAENRSL